MSAVLCAAQTPAKFSNVTSTSGETPENIYAVDLNNDGLTDIIQDTGLSPSGFTVSINNGNGTFKAPVLYKFPVTYSAPSAMATADFNNDGNVDVAVAFNNTNQIAVYLGNGDGTFQSPEISTIDLPSGWTFLGYGAGAAAADFNADGKIDLVVWASNANSSSDLSSSSTELYVLEGDGSGGFSNPHGVFTGPPENPGFQTFVGDYDSDGKADIAVKYYSEDYSTGINSSVALNVLYGNNDFTFHDTTAYTAGGGIGFYAGSGDLNSDGYTDLYGMVNDGSTEQLAVFYGKSSRTFDNYFMDIPNDINFGGEAWISVLTMADFNGDGRMDLAAISQNANFQPLYFSVFLAGNNPGEFTQQLVDLPRSYIQETSPVAGLFSGSYLTPDAVLNQSPNYGSPPQNTPSYLVSELNGADSGWFGPCRYPHKGEDFNVCVPGTALGSSASRLFSATANSYGQLRKIELWVDGKKVQEQHHTWDQHAYFDWSGTFSPGEHHATFYAADVDNRLQQYDFTFTVSGS